jgi:hypothetical protein
MLNRLTEPWECVQGEILKRQVNFAAAGVADDIAGWTFDLQLRKDARSPIAAIATVEAQAPTTDGIATITLDTTNIEPRTYKFDLRVVRGGQKKFYLVGEILILPAITQ